MIPDLTDLCRIAALGSPTEPPQAVTGGLLHRMFRVRTTGGDYAVKLLNPRIMARPEAMDNMLRSEAAARALCAHVPAVTARLHAGSPVIPCAAGQCMVYPWQRGGSIHPPALTVLHARAMGDVLGRIHRAGVSVPGLQPAAQPRPLLPWPDGCDGQLRRWDAQVVAAQARLLGTQVISHRDLDPKNVMWQDDAPLIIDWEAAGYVNPWQEVVEMLNYWADDDAKAVALLDAWSAHMPCRAADWDAAVTAAMDSMLGWLHRNLWLSRSADAPDERAAAAVQTASAFAELRRCEARSRRLRELLPR